jgi:hypothetical protein
VEEPDAAKAKEETTSSLRARDVGALNTLRREQCVMSTESWKFNQKRCPLLGYSTIKSEATEKRETLCLRSNGYSYNSRRTVRSSIFCVVCLGSCMTVQYHSCKKICFLLGTRRAHIWRIETQLSQLKV